MPPPIQTYYENSPEEQEDLLELRKDYYRTLRSLQRRAARYGDAGVPAPIASAIAEAEANIRAIDEARGGVVSTATAERIGATGQFNILTQRLELLSQQVLLSQKQADEWRDVFRSALDDLAQHQRGLASDWHEAIDKGVAAVVDDLHTFQRTTRMVVGALAAALFVLALIFGAALWSLR